jgi:hypothetical protein
MVYPVGLKKSGSAVCLDAWVMRVYVGFFTNLLDDSGMVGIWSFCSLTITSWSSSSSETLGVSSLIGYYIYLIASAILCLLLI